jgi:uncharacterized protein DUF5906
MSAVLPPHLSDLLGRLNGVAPTGLHKWRALCPGHDDHDPSLDIALGDNDNILLFCRSRRCPTEQIVAALGTTMAALFAPRNGHSATPEIADDDPRMPMTVRALAKRKRLPVEFLQSLGLRDQDHGVVIPYFDRDGGLIAEKRRTAWVAKKGSWWPKGRKLAAYGQWRLHAARDAGYLLVVEGESDCWAAWAHRIPALGLPGSGAAETLELEHLEGVARTWIVQEPDGGGDGFRSGLGRRLPEIGFAGEAYVVRMPDGLKDLADLHADDPERFVARLWAQLEVAEPMDLTADAAAVGDTASAVGLESFYAYMPMHLYLYIPARALWPAASVNARIPPVPIPGTKKSEPATGWLDRNRPVEQMTWSPGDPMLIEGRLIAEGGWVEQPGVRVFNLYRPSTAVLGDATAAGPWLEHVRRLYPGDAEHIIAWVAHRVQRPAEKVNHALVLGGAQGIGKDTLLEPVKEAVGAWNVAEVSPIALMGRFNGHVKSVILRISEARDLGEVNRYTFYDHMKVYTASPPDVLRVDEKNLREYMVPNVCGVVITTNHKTDGIYLPEDDRRHYVAWSECTKEGFEPEYWTRLWRWYAEGGAGHVAAYLATLDLSTFNPKAPPPHTDAFFAIVDSSRAPEANELTEALEALKKPEAVTLPDAVTLDDIVRAVTDGDFRVWLLDRRNSRVVPHRMEDAGYVPVRNPHETRGRWMIQRRQRVVYARKSLTPEQRHAAAQRLTQPVKAD